MKLARLTASGLDAFAAYLARLAEQPSLDPPLRLLADPGASEPVPGDIEVEDKVFATRFEAAAYLHTQLAASRLRNWNRDAGLWAWLALYYFDQVCPRGAQRSRRVGETARYIPQVDVSRRAYRHTLLGPVTMYHAHADNPERLRGLLSSPMHTATAVTYVLFMENPTLVSCNAIVELATDLYYDPAKGTLRRGAGSRDSGGCRRLIEFLQQIDCTYDLAALDKERLIEMLPREFHRFLPVSRRLALSPGG